MAGSDCYKLHSPAGDEVPSPDRVVKIITNIEGIVARQAALDAQTLVWDHHGRGKLLRPVILSMEDCFTPEDREAAFKKLELMAREYAAAFAPGAAYIGIIHRDRWHPHIHLFLQFNRWSHDRLAAVDGSPHAIDGLDISRRAGTRPGPQPGRERLSAGQKSRRPKTRNPHAS